MLIINSQLNTDLEQSERNKIIGYLKARVFLSEENATKLLNRVEYTKIHPIAKDLEQRYASDNGKAYYDKKYKSPQGYTMRTFLGAFGTFIFKEDSEYYSFINQGKAA